MDAVFFYTIDMFISASQRFFFFFFLRAFILEFVVTGLWLGVTGKDAAGRGLKTPPFICLLLRIIFIKGSK